jgi:hypothetical protein
LIDSHRAKLGESELARLLLVHLGGVVVHVRLVAIHAHALQDHLDTTVSIKNGRRRQYLHRGLVDGARAVFVKTLETFFQVVDLMRKVGKSAKISGGCLFPAITNGRELDYIVVYLVMVESCRLHNLIKPLRAALFLTHPVSLVCKAKNKGSTEDNPNSATGRILVFYWLPILVFD